MASLAFLSPPLGRRAWRRYERLANLPKACLERLPSLSIIVPARDEADNLRTLLPSLNGQHYPGDLEIIVVDDGSADDTAGVAREHRCTLLSVDHLPPGWLGKPYACQQGAGEARGEWLLFTDADTCHQPDSAARAVSYAIENRLDGLSLFLYQEAFNWLDAIAQEAAMAGLFAGLPPQHPALNGQYILLRRAVFDASGGFAAVRAEPVEDLAFGRHLHDLGYAVAMLRGSDVARVAMYRDLGHMWRGMARIGVGSLRWSGIGSLLTALFITAVMTPLVVLLLFAGGRIGRKWIWLTWPAAISGLWPWSRGGEPGAGWRLALAPIGAVVVQLASCWGLVCRLRGRGIPWKGRNI